MNFKPFYVSTEGVSEKQAQELLNLAVKNGSEGEDSFLGAYAEYEWTDPHPGKIVERFNNKLGTLPSGEVIKFKQGAPGKAEQYILRKSLRGI